MLFARLSLPFLMVIPLLCPAPLVGQEPNSTWKTGNEWETQLDAPALLSIEGISLRDLLRRLEKSYRVATLLDRRVDPEQLVTLESSNLTLRETLKKLAGELGLGVSFPDHVIYLGPHSSARRLRTLIESREQKIQSKSKRLPADRRQRLESARIFGWDDLAEPRKLLLQMAKDKALSVTSADMIPHDLWAKATLPDVSFAAALSLLLIQYDQTFEFDLKASAITLIPIPDEIRISKDYLLNREDKPAQWPRVAPTAEISVTGKRATVLGRSEDHDAIDDFRNGKLPPQEGGVEVAPLSQRRFTLRIEQVALFSIIGELEKSGIRFVYSEREFAQAKINLKQIVKIDAENATPEEFFHSLFDPVGVEFKISGITVELTPNK